SSARQAQHVKLSTSSSARQAQHVKLSTSSSAQKRTMIRRPFCHPELVEGWSVEGWLVEGHPFYFITGGLKFV
ncbi:hypothetical protein, partial [Niabella drilacis]|uniref:hypothetical protein n=1 Tax=Niabella drilacis (strain DSM 25811 / CCM 8410 / CCUG 62505 / LMG 26954 / E90) TaxID=1285928 RepID=UPI001C40BA8D